MKRFLSLVFLIGCFLIANTIYVRSKKQRNLNQIITQSYALPQLPSQIVLKSPQIPTTNTHLSKNEKKVITKTTSSLEQMTDLLKVTVKNKMSLTDTAQWFNHNNLSPQIAKDTNQHTGDMYVLRTESPLPGTRYFHAQYFSNGKSMPFLQHMSFEVPPGKTAMNTAKQQILKTFPELSSPVIEKQNFIMWHWKEGYNVWAKILDSNDIEDDPFNAYTKNDIGTVRIAMELDVVHDE